MYASMILQYANHFDETLFYLYYNAARGPNMLFFWLRKHKLRETK